MKHVRLSEEAVDELFEAARWYRARQPGLDREFLDEFEKALPLIGSAPASFPRIDGIHAALVIRRALLPRFPYAVVFMEVRGDIRVLAVAHAKRRPGYWINRVIG